MSALAAALAAFAPSGVVASVLTDEQARLPSDIPSSSSSPGGSPQSTCSSLPDVSSVDAAVSHLSPPSLSLLMPSERLNEHLAVLLPKHLWKPDSLAAVCDSFFCRVKFTMFERRHHCRKCGGVYCKTCAGRVTDLLDTSNLSFLHPPRNVPLSAFESPSSPILKSRVCDDCWDQINGCPSTPRTPELASSSCASSIIMPRSLSPNDSGESSLCSSPSTSDGSINLGPPIQRKLSTLRSTPSMSSLNSNYNSATHPTPRRAPLRAAHLPLPDLERSYGELDAYPLKRSSLLCKATGGGRWEPKQTPVLVGYRVPVPGGKAPYEVQLEKEVAMEKLRKENPVIRDGDFQYRFPRDPEPAMLSRSFQISTF